MGQGLTLSARIVQRHPESRKKRHERREVEKEKGGWRKGKEVRKTTAAERKERSDELFTVIYVRRQVVRNLVRNRKVTFSAVAKKVTHK